MHSTVYLSLGSNLGDRRALLQQAISLLGQRVGIVEASSSFIETEPWGFESEHPFLNAAVRVSTLLTPFQLLLVTQQIEREMGRTHKSTANMPNGGSSGPKYHDRPIDIDILIYNMSKNAWQNDAPQQSAVSLQLDGLYAIDGQLLSLTLPHPLMHERDFVMIPLREILE